MEYGMNVKWQAGEIDAFKRFNAMCREQAAAIFAWDRDSVRGVAVGPRPIARPAAELAAIARAA